MGIKVPQPPPTNKAKPSPPPPPPPLPKNRDFTLRIENDRLRGLVKRMRRALHEIAYDEHTEDAQRIAIDALAGGVSDDIR